jgi:DNA polymerase III subunit epsilon
MYAIVDIETTGGRPDNDRITEIAIVIHDGTKVVETFSTLINPQCSIPYNITMLTGINNDMVRDAPKFYEVAKQIHLLLQDKVFVAHSVRFDYGFVKSAFKDLGANFSSKTLCTVRLSRKAFPGYPSYSLGKICDHLGIKIENRHRALGDATATAILFDKILKQNNNLEDEWLASEQKLTSFPPLLDKVVFEKIPEGKTGVYYFHDQDGNVIYVGKANDIKKRITQHFSMNGKGSRKSILLKSELADISYEETGSELIALLLESDEIKKIKPKYNVAQKRTRAVPFYGIYETVDKQGYLSLSISRIKEGEEPLSTSDSMEKAKEFLYKQITKFDLCLAKCDLHKTGGPCFHWHIQKCKGACGQVESPEDYNQRATQAIESFSFQNESFFLVSKGRHEDEMAIVCIENGRYKGFGYLDTSFGQPSLDDMRSCIKKYPHNRDIQNILCGVKGKVRKVEF